MIVHPTYGGDVLRVRFTHRLGAEPVTLGGASIGLQAAAASIVPGSLRRLRFGCAESIVLPPGHDVLSDPIDLAFSAFENLSITFHIEGEIAAATRHDQAFQTSYVATTDLGDLTETASGTGFDQETESWFLINGLEVAAPEGASAIVALGDSITDGFISDGGFSSDPAVVDRNLRYPDFLAERVSADARFSVLNLGIGGNRLLRGPVPGFPGQGPSLLSRLEADVLGQAGVEDVIVLIGTNDLGIPFPRARAEEVIAGLELVIDRLQEEGLNVLLGTQTPASGPSILSLGHGSPDAIDARNSINTWVKTQSRADAVVDFHAALRDPANPEAMRPDLDSGDHLHPSPTGYRAMADAVDLGALRGTSSR